jgi:hypothetical protein
MSSLSSRLRAYASVNLPGSQSNQVQQDLLLAAETLESVDITSWEDLRCGECNTVYPAPTCPDCANVDNEVTGSHPLLSRFLRRN